MKIAITGYDGFVGSKLDYHPLVCDITEEEEVKEALAKTKPDVLIHLAAITDIETCQVSSDVFKVNVLGTCNLLDNFKGTLIYLSTDHVFNGKKWFDFGYSERHEPAPLNIYGLTKLSAESLVSTGKQNKIIRTSKLFDYSMVEPIVDTIDAGGEIEVTNLIRRGFLHVDHFIEGLKWVVDNLDKVPSLLHLAGTDILSYYKFYQIVCQHYDLDISKLSARTHELKLVAPRPLRGGLNVSRAKKLGVPLYSVYDGIKNL